VNQRVVTRPPRVSPHLLAATLVGSFVMLGGPPPRAQENGTIQGTVRSGVTATVDKDGKLSLSVNGPITLDDDRILRQSDKRWKLVAAGAPAGPVTSLRGVDFLVDGVDYIGRRVKVTGGRIYGADTSSAVLSLTGGSVRLVTRGMPRDTLRDILSKCAGPPSSDASCRRSVVGTVAKQKYAGDLELYHLEIMPPTTPAPKPTQPRGKKSRMARAVSTSGMPGIVDQNVDAKASFIGSGPGG
jgi:hypothetical protein